ncbi:MAG TPA: signal peptidase I [Succinivibrionaceae bacterium]|nr:signal peptidase I [Succinivibrionaceae bacterium]
MNTFSVLLAVLSVVTGICWIYDFFKKRPERIRRYKASIESAPALSKKERRKLLEPSGFIGQCASLFFIVLFVFLFRAFIIEPFRIPSGSMLPTLQSGDFIAVTKWSYGIRNPLTNDVLFRTGAPKRGDVVVFKYPEDTSVDYIKRVVGMPGDIVIYHDKQIYLIPAGSPEGTEPALISRSQKGNFVDESSAFAKEHFDVFEEQLGDVKHRIMINPNAPGFEQNFFRQRGAPLAAWKVPEDCYFVMGDNRDNSADSRYWGFVPYDNLIGKTVGVWLSFDFNRKNTDLLPSWIPSSVNFNRIGGLH